MQPRLRKQTGPAGAELVERLRRGTPESLLPLLIGLRSRIAWSMPSVRADAVRQMSFLLGEEAAAGDLQPVARRYVTEMARRAELRWHPEAAIAVQLRGAEHLLSALELGRGVVLSFVHHGLYDRAFPSVARTGVTLDLMVHPYMLRDDTPGWLRQHVWVNSIGGGRAISTEIGSSGIADLLSGGDVVAIASDVPGRTPVRFADQTVLGSSGAARIAAATNTPVVLMTSERDEHGETGEHGSQSERVRLHPALLPETFGSPEELLDEMLSRHGHAVLAWPEATDLPLSRWGTVAEPAEAR
jgi:lauroyl/myristoyl acyltransferase